MVDFKQMLKRRFDRRIAADRAFLGSLAAIGTGVAGTTVLFLLIGLAQTSTLSEVYGVLLLIFFVAPVALIGWLIGLLMIGVPGILILHLMGVRWPAATGLYGGAAVCVVLLPVWLNGEAVGWMAAVGMTLAGIAAGWVLNIVAYRSPHPVAAAMN